MAMKASSMAGYRGPSYWPNVHAPKPVAPVDPERIKRIEKETALHLALNSDNPTVIDATERLLVAVRLAHGEDFAAKRGEIRDAVAAMRAGYEEEEQERRQERRREEQERDYRRTMASVPYTIAAIIAVTVLFMLVLAMGSGR